MTTADRGRRLSAGEACEQLGSLALTTHSLHSVLQTIADLARQVMPGDTETSVSWLAADRPATVVYTGQLALDLDESQYGRGYGPCLHAAARGERVEVTDARTERRWADYMRAAVERGALSSLSLPLGHPVPTGAALNIYFREPAGFDEAGARTADDFARAAGVTLSNMHAYESAREVAANLQSALGTRATIDQAKGILMERHQLTAEQAFLLLAHAATGIDRPLNEIADHLVVTGELLGPTGRSTVPLR
jgi:GAF domain-containing protein